jgi:hypothetical protein
VILIVETVLDFPDVRFNAISISVGIVAIEGRKSTSRGETP